MLKCAIIAHFNPLIYIHLPVWHEKRQQNESIALLRGFCNGVRGFGFICGTCQEYRYPDCLSPTPSGGDKSGILKPAQPPGECIFPEPHGVLRSLTSHNQILRSACETFQVPEKYSDAQCRTTGFLCRRQPWEGGGAFQKQHHGLMNRAPDGWTGADRHNSASPLTRGSTVKRPPIR